VKLYAGEEDLTKKMISIAMIKTTVRRMIR
jgi:hypothetical protein